MKNLTLRVDDQQLAQARRIARARATSVNALIREFLEGLINEGERQATARKELLRLSGESRARVGPGELSRERLYEG